MPRIKNEADLEIFKSKILVSICDPVKKKVHLVGHVYSEIMNNI